MFYDETKAMIATEEDPSLVFELLKENHIALIDKLLSKKTFDINVCDEMGNNILTRLLKKGCYDVVLKHMKNKNWDINHQNNDGNTFAHVLVTINYVNVIDIIAELKKNKNFIPNIKNNKGETILDRSINENYIYTTVKVLEDKRFNNIDILSFKNLYNTYIKSSNYGSFSKLNNLQIILEHLEDKPLLPKMERLISILRLKYDAIKEEAIQNKTDLMDQIIDSLLMESNA